jgi:hypothetical protein
MPAGKGTSLLDLVHAAFALRVASSPIRVSRVEDSPEPSPGNQQAISFVWCA